MDCCNHQCEACHKHKERTPEEMKALINRLNRIEGQVRGIRGMVENSAYCPDILTQVAATSAALNAFTKELLASHIRTCVADDIRAGHDEAIDELVQTLQNLDLPPVNLRFLQSHLTKNAFAIAPTHLCGIALEPKE
ncbi:MAG: metal-sensing transcriptional repressor [Faecalibacterium sp.]|nr:metal-sensing transcriptional repressor [Faecalibacterium sp.]